MKRFYTLLTLTVLLFTVSCRKEDSSRPDCDNQEPVLTEKQNLAAVPQGDPLTQAQIDKTIAQFMDSKTDFTWEWVDLKTLWSAVYNSDHTLAVGYKPSGMNDVMPVLHEINLKDAKWKAVHDALIELVVNEINKSGEGTVTAQQIIVEDDQVLPIITFRITNRNAITRLYNLENVRYLEPLGYWPADNRYRIQSTSGCSAATEPLNSADYTTIAPGCLLPWNYNNVNIPAAWNIAQGAGIKIGVIDGGISSAQTLLSGMFNNGYSNVARTITTDYTYGTSAFTSCTHGNSMSGLAVGPRNDQNAVTGVAYKSSLHFIRGCEDVVLDQSAEKTGVKNALIRMGNISDVKVISMSIGYPFSSSVLKDGVVYANNLGKMIFAAAGTSYGWTSWWGVIYPAAYAECYAVTGVRENGSKCASCHDGSAVKFTVTMERDVNNNRNSLSIPQSGSVPTYIGGSSAATSTAAGIAALVWSVKPSLTRAQVYTCMKNTAQNYPNISGNHGYGRLNAGAAVTLAQTY
jgi:serine protease